MAEERFFMPARVCFGRDAVRKHAADLAGLGTKALIVTGRRSAKLCGVYDDITGALDAEGVGHVLFDEVEENPSVTTIMKARDLGLAEKVDFVIGAGGGSPMDAAKAIALMIRHADQGREYLYTPGQDNSCIPVVCIPTTCGTGSEVTAVSVLTNDEKMVKKSIPFKLFPVLSLIDGKYLRAAGRSVLSNTAFDALSHLYESYLNADATPLSRLIAMDGMREWKRCLPVLRGEAEPGEEDYDAMMRAAMLGGMAIAHTGTSLPHGMSYALTCGKNVPHGKAVCCFMAGYLKEADRAEAKKVLQLSGFRSIADFWRTYRACCGALQIDEAQLLSILEQDCTQIGNSPDKLEKAPFGTDGEAIRRIVFSAMEKYPYRAVLFDLDGTINDSGPGIMNSVRYALRKMGREDPGEKTLCRFVGPSLVYSFTTFIGMSEEDARKAVEEYRVSYHGGECFNLNIYDGIRELLTDLNRAGIKCAVVTSKPQAASEKILKHFDMTRYFETVAGPDPDDPSNEKSVLIRRALKNLDMTPDDVIMVGDSQYDIIGAKEAGCDSVGVTYGYGTREELVEHEADYLADRPDELRKIFGI